MHRRHLGWFGAMLCCASTLLLPRFAGAGVAKDPFPGMRVRRIAVPAPVAKLALHGTDGRIIRLSDYRGKAVLVEFFIAN